MSVRDHYLKTIRSRYAHRGTWLPNRQIALGDVGTIVDGSFERVTTLGALGVEFAIRKGAEPLTFDDGGSSGAAIGVSAGVGGDAAPVGGKLSVDFTRDGAFVFQAVDCLVDEIEDRAAVGRALVPLYRLKEWQLEWRVIDTVVRAGTATIMIAQSAGSHVELAAHAPVTGTNLADPSLGLTVSAKRGDVTAFVAEKGLTPLFKTARFRRTWIEWLLRKPATMRFAGETHDGEPEPDGDPLDDDGGDDAS